jgi:8-oxo-dGTP diphosphatase
VIEAAGGVVWRSFGMTGIEVLLVHRPRRDDWSLPKGKRRRDESAVACALREVHEETGLRCATGPELPETRYRDRKGRAKRVRYWAMHPLEGEFRANAEVDEVCWLHIRQARELMTYEHDLLVVDGLHAALAHLR